MYICLYVYIYMCMNVYMHADIHAGLCSEFPLPPKLY